MHTRLFLIKFDMTFMLFFPINYVSMENKSAGFMQFYKTISNLILLVLKFNFIVFLIFSLVLKMSEV